MKTLEGLTQQVILRRTSEVLVKLLPPRPELLVRVALTPLQARLYKRALDAPMPSTPPPAGGEGASTSPKDKLRSRALLNIDDEKRSTPCAAPLDRVH